MKHNILTVLIPALLFPCGVNAAELYNKNGNKVDIYGQIDVRHSFANKDNQESGDNSRAKIGFIGETQINKDLIGYGRFEYEIKTYTTEDDNKGTTEFGYAGFKFANNGTLDYGRNYGVIYDTNAWTDVLPLFGADSMSQDDVYMTGKATGVLTYRNTDMFGYVDGLNFALQYQGKNKHDANGDGFGFSADYNLGLGVTLGGGYSNSSRTTSQYGGYTHGKRAEAWNVGVKFSANNVYLAAMYGETRNMTTFEAKNKINDMEYIDVANKAQHIELVAQYDFIDYGVKPSIAYVQSKGKDLNANIDNFDVAEADLVKYISVGSFYEFNKNMTAVVDYKINLLKADNKFFINNDNIVGLGLIYQF